MFSALDTTKDVGSSRQPIHRTMLLVALACLLMAAESLQNYCFSQNVRMLAVPWSRYLVGSFMSIALTALGGYKVKKVDSDPLH